MPIVADDPRLASAHSGAASRYDDVPFQRPGASGVQLPKISLGLWQNFGRDRSIESQREILLHSFDRGVVHIDVANNYGPPYGAAESTLGMVLESDLGRMRTDYVDVFYSHRPDPETPLEETVQALVDIVRSGKTLYVGISNYPAPLARRAHELLAAEGVRPLLHQPRYSLFDRTPETELFPLLHELEVGSAVSPLAQGLLTGKYINGNVPTDSRAASSHHFNESALTPDYLHRIRGIDGVARKRGSIPQLAVAWVLRDQVVTTAIVGASRPRQVDDAITASKTQLPTEVPASLDEFAAPAGGATV